MMRTTSMTINRKENDISTLVMEYDPRSHKYQDLSVSRPLRWMLQHHLSVEGPEQVPGHRHQRPRQRFWQRPWQLQRPCDSSSPIEDLGHSRDSQGEIENTP